MSPTNSDLTFRRAEGTDRPAILELLRISLGREVEDRYEALFAWKHIENTFGPSPAWLACDGDRVAGFRTFMRWEFVDPTQGSDRVIRAVRAVDTATHPDYQGRGIFTRLTRHALDELAEDGVECVFNTPNDQSRPGYLKMGWTVVGQLDTSVRPTKWRRVGRLATARVAADRWSLSSTAGVDASDTLADTTALTALLEEQAPAPGASTRLSPEFLRWRFGTPLLGYRAIPAPRGLDHGLAIFRIRARGSAREAALVSLLSRADDRRTRAELVRAVTRAVDADYVIALGMPALGPGGLLRLPRTGPVLTCRTVAAAPPSHWSLTLGDIELF